MKLLVRQFLLFGVIFGLVSQGMAFAANPCATMQMTYGLVQAMQTNGPAQAAMVMPTAGKMEGCSETGRAKMGSTPAKKSMLNCPMMAGCSVSLAAAVTDQPVVPVIMPQSAVSAVWPLIIQLASRATAPEPPPPTL